MVQYCTYLDFRYFTRGVLLYQSLKQHSPKFKLWVLCLDDIAYESFAEEAFPEVHLVRLAELEASDTDLAKVKGSRSAVEYYFTLTPIWNRFVLKKLSDRTSLFYLDADLYFFNDPTEVLEELSADKSTLIVPHRFPDSLKEYEVFGKYNVGLVGFRHVPEAFACLDWWRERCLEWCFDYLDGKRYADQKYLDDWPTRFSGVAICKHPGANVAPWNIVGQDVHLEKGRPYLESGAPIVFFHFHKVLRINDWLFDLGLDFKGRFSKSVKAYLYRPYLEAWRRHSHQFSVEIPAESVEKMRPSHYPKKSWRDILTFLLRGRIMLVSGASSTKAVSATER